MKSCFKEILSTWKLRITNFISDRHPQMRKYMRDTYGDNRANRRTRAISHFFDVWHVAKGKIEQNSQFLLYKLTSFLEIFRITQCC